MTPTENDIGRLVRKRDQPSRRFVIVDVDGDEVTLQDLVFIGMPEFVVSDLRTYEWIGEKRHNGGAS